MKQSKLTHGSLFSGIEGFGLGAAFAGIKDIGPRSEEVSLYCRL